MRYRFIGLLFLAALFFTPSVWPEEPKPDAKPLEAQAVDPAAKVVHDEHTVYIPYDEIERVFEKEGRGVFLPYAEFIKLWEKARPVEPPKPKPKPPFDAAISAANYEGSITGDAASITASYSIEMLKDEGWATLPLPLSGVAVTDSTVEGGKALLNVTDKGYDLLMGAAGAYKLILKFVARVDRQPGKNSFSFGCPRAAVSRLQMTLPGKDLAIKVEPLLVASSPETTGEQTVVQAFLGSTDKVAFEWAPKTVEKAREEALLFVKTHLAVAVREGSLRADATLVYDILRAPTDQFEVSVPADFKVIAVEGANIKDWSAQAAGDRQTVRATLHSPEKKAYQLKLCLERPVDTFPADLAIPEIIPVVAARENGLLAVTKSEFLEAKVKTRSGLSQLAAEDLPDALKAKDIFFAGSFVNHPFSLVLSVSKIEPKVTAEATTVATILKENLLLNSSFHYRIRKAGLFKLRFRLPSALEIREVGDPATVEDYSVAEEGGVKTVTVTLAHRAFGDFKLPIVCEQTRTAETGELPLPVPEILDVERERGTIAVAAHETLEAKITASQNVTPLGLQELQGANLLSLLNESDQPIPQAAPSAEARIVFGFQYLKQPVSVTLVIEKRKPQVTIRVDSHIQVAEEAVKLQTSLFYTIKYAGITELSFSVPARLGDELRITGPNIKEKVRTPIEGEGSKRDRWRVTLQSETIGEYALQLEYETKIEGVKKGEASTFDVPEIIVNDVARENGFFAFSKGQNVEVEAEDPKALEEIDTRELTGTSLVSTGAFLSFKYLYHPYELKLKMTLHEYIGVIQTLVNEAHLESVFSKDGRLMTEASFLVQNNQRPVIPLLLPETAEVRSLFVNEQPERPRKGEKGQLLVPVAKVTSGNTFLVRLVYETPANGGEMGWVGSLQAAAPHLPEEIPVLRLLWDVYAPAGYEYLWFGGNMQVTEQRVRGWRSIKEVARYITPRLAPRIGGREQFQQAPKQMAGNQGGGAGAGAFAVDFPREGIRHQFSKLSGDGEVSLPYLKAKVYTAIDILFFVLTLVMGGRWARRRPKAHVFLGLAAGSVLLASFFPVAIAGWLDSVFWGAVVLGVVWAAPPIFRRLREGWARCKQRWQNWREQRREARQEREEARREALKEIMPKARKKETPEGSEEKEGKA